MSIAVFSINYAFGAEVEVVHIPPPHHLLNYYMKGVQSDIVRNDDRSVDFEEAVFDGDFQLKTSFSRNEKEIRRIRKPISLFHYGLLALIIVNLLVICCGSVRWSRPETVAPTPGETAVEETPRTELQAIHRYWTKKLAEKTDDRLPYRIDPMIAALAVVGAVAAWIPVLLSLRKHRFPVRSAKRLWERKTGKAVEKEPEPKD